MIWHFVFKTTNDPNFHHQQDFLLLIYKENWKLWNHLKIRGKERKREREREREKEREREREKERKRDFTRKIGSFGII